MGNSMQGNRLHVFSKCENASLTLIQEKIGFLKRKWSFFAFYPESGSGKRFRDSGIRTSTPRIKLLPIGSFVGKDFLAQNS